MPARTATSSTHSACDFDVVVTSRNVVRCCAAKCSSFVLLQQWLNTTRDNVLSNYVAPLRASSHQHTTEDGTEQTISFEVLLCTCGYADTDPDHGTQSNQSKILPAGVAGLLTWAAGIDASAAFLAWWQAPRRPHQDAVCKVRAVPRWQSWNAVGAEFGPGSGANNTGRQRDRWCSGPSHVFHGPFEPPSGSADSYASCQR